MDAEIVSANAVIRSVDGSDALVEVAQGGCGRCHEKGGCGGQSLTQALCAKPKTYRVRNPEGFPPGTPVTVAIPAGAVRQGATQAYGLPLVTLIGGAMLGKALGGEMAAVAGAGIGLVAAWWHLRRRDHGLLENAAFQPYITRRS